MAYFRGLHSRRQKLYILTERKIYILIICHFVYWLKAAITLGEQGKRKTMAALETHIQ